MKNNAREYLKVPFAEKDQAKALGARWEPAQRHWYVPGDVDPEPFARWRIADDAGSALETDAPINACDVAASAESLPGESLLAVMSRIAGAIHQAAPQPLWVRAEAAQVHHKRGNIGLELVESDAAGNQLASLRAMIFSRKATGIAERFRQSTGDDIQAGQKLLLQLKLRFDARYGLSASVEDIDPGYTLGDAERKRRMIREALQKAGQYTLQQRFALPADYWHVVVIAPEAAAGLGDFRATADRLQRAGLCAFDYVTATFEGPTAPASLIQAVNTVQQRMEQGQAYQALVVIRGGGASSGLHWLNDLPLARQLCTLSIPVLTGLGHERDSTILDEVAARSFDTPSKVVGYLRERLIQSAHEARSAMQLIQQQSRQALERQQNRINRLQQGCCTDAQRMLLRTRPKLQDTLHRAKDTARRPVSRSRNALEQAWQRSQLVTRITQKADHRMQALHAQLHRAALQLPQMQGRALHALWSQLHQNTRHLNAKAGAKLQFSQQEALSRARQSTALTQRQLASGLGGIMAAQSGALPRAQRLLQPLLRRSQDGIRSVLLLQRERMDARHATVQAYSPQNTLARGYALIETRDGHIATSCRDLHSDDPVRLRLQDGRVDARILQLHRE